MVGKKNVCLTAALLVLTVFFCGCRDAAAGETILIGSAASPGEMPGEISPAPGGEGTEPREESPESRAMIRVYVCGAVYGPGVVELAPGSRIEDALAAAGGFLPGAALEAVNLADWVRDGQMVYFPREGEETAAEPASGKPAAEGGGPVNINTADRALLSTLPGIGEARAAEIIAYREAHGGFSCCEELMQVTGIKTGIYEKLRDKITVR